MSRINRRLAALEEPLRATGMEVGHELVDRLETFLSPEEIELWYGAVQRNARGEAPPYTEEELAVDAKIDADPEASALFRQLVRFEWAMYYLEGAKS